MSRHRRLRALAALTWLAAMPAMASQCNIQLLPSIPVTLQGLRPMVSTRINGRKARFIIDTGAFWSMLSPAAEAEYGLPERLHTTGLRLQGVNGGAETDVAIAYTFTFLDHDFHAVEFLVGGNDFGGGAAGILGGNLLRIANAEFDFAHGRMRFFEARHCGDGPLAYWASNQPVGVVDLEPSDSHSPGLIGHARLNGKRITVQFDTGSPQSMLTLAAARRAGITPATPGVKPAGSIFGIGTQTSKSWVAPVSSFEIGGEKIENTHVLVGDIDLQDVDMLLGADFFLSHRVSVVYGRNKLYFTYNGGPIFNRGQPYWIEKAGGALVRGGTAAAQDAKPASAAELEREGRAALSERQYPAALADLTRACSLEPRNAAFLFERSKAYVAQGQTAEALSDLDTAIGLQPKLYRARLARATLLLHWRGAPAGAESEAGGDADTADRLAPKESQLRFALAAVYARLGRYRTAIREIDDWMRYHDQDVMLPDGFDMRCWIRAEGDLNLHGALRDCDRALEQLPRSAAVLDHRGLVYLRLGQLERSIEDYGSALKIDPGSATSLYGRGLAELREGRAKAGQADLGTAQKHDPEVAARFARMGLPAAAAAPL